MQVAAKTGTAQTGTGQINAWFVAFAPAANPTIAVAVVLPNQPSADEYQGGTLAAPIAKAMIEAYLAGGTGTEPTAPAPDDTAAPRPGGTAAPMIHRPAPMIAPPP